ncbi:MAG: ABC transporter ATP-binding protein [Gammaproteobacteria bacterium AqS3]|nr:ABC transporter ATP-binding protein [Gammaproteobacteria bacterium AqS3]
MAQIDPDIVVEARTVSKSVALEDGELQILSQVDLLVRRGQSQAITGVSGSGKSTLLGLLAGLDRPTSGQVLLCGHDTSQLDEAAAAELRRRHTAFVFQSFQLLEELTALENILLPLELHGGIPDAQERARAALAAVQLEHRAGHFPVQLSGGEQQRVALARAYAQHPTVLFADEPTGNLDRATAETVRQLMFDLVGRGRMALLLVTHDEALAGHCDSILQLDALPQGAPA